MSASFRIPKESAALLVIDMQNGFVHPDSGMGKSPSGTLSQQKIITPILGLVEFCRASRIPVIWSQQEHFPEDKTRLNRIIQPHSRKQGFLPCLRGSWETNFYEGIKSAIRAEDHVVAKHRASVFFQTNLETKLKMLGTRFLLISGCNTEFCVESTVRDAYARDFEIILLKDCVAGIQQKFHERSLELIQAYFGEVLSMAELQDLVV